MNHKFTVGLALSALILTCGCKKSIKPDSVDLGTKAKAGFVTNTDWQQPGLAGRVIRYDIDDGNGSDCLFAYNISTGAVSLTQISGTNSTTIVAGPGIRTDNAGNIDVKAYNTDVTDFYNEVGGVHIIPYDADGSGHEDHLLMYIPLRHTVYLLSYSGGGYWHLQWGSTSGIGGYDLGGITDKIISYDYGGGTKRDLICYRPGNRFVWLIQNTGTAASPNWVARVQSNGGIGGFDMAGTMDQLVAFGGAAPGYMDLIAYRPSYGYVWVLAHGANNTTWYSSILASRTGFYAGSGSAPYFSLGSLQDRVVVINGGLNGSDADDDIFMPYRPGSGLGVSYIYGVNYSTGVGLGGISLYPGLNYPMTNNPYGSPGGGAGDHVVAFSPTAQGNTDLLFYSNGANTQSQLYEWNAGTGAYTQVY
jgi:hypothetical protein